MIEIVWQFLAENEKSRVFPAKGGPMRSREQALNFRLFAGFSTSVVISFLILLFFCSNALFAKPVDVKDAQKAVKGWLKLDSNPLGVSFGEQVLKTDVFADA